MLTSLHITLTPTAPVTLPAWLGRATHAWFLDTVQQHDPGLAAELHTPNQDRPFTVSDLWGPGLARQGKNRLTPGTAYSLRVTGCRADVSGLVERLAQEPPSAVRLLDHPFQVLAATTDPAASSWAGRASFESLAQKYMLAPQQPDQLTLHFASPTVFRSHDAYLPLPLPRLVFEGLARRWNSLSPITIADEVVRYAEECLLISRYRLQTERVDRGQRGSFPAFTGSCTYAFKVRDRYWMGLIHLLAAFAFYAGVGKQTAMGLGQVRGEGRKGGREDRRKGGQEEGRTGGQEEGRTGGREDRRTGGQEEGRTGGREDRSVAVYSMFGGKGEIADGSEDNESSGFGCVCTGVRWCDGDLSAFQELSQAGNVFAH